MVHRVAGGLRNGVGMGARIRIDCRPYTDFCGGIAIAIAIGVVR
jgi:hypothetical protein